jgi:hypothetical protein
LNLFEKIQTDGNNSIAVLKWLAKRGNPEAYEAWRIKHTEHKCLLPLPVKPVVHNSIKNQARDAKAEKIESVAKALPTQSMNCKFAETDEDVANILFDELKDVLK